MKTLYIDCGMGAAGDMLAAALLELLPDPEGFTARLNALGIPGVEFKREAAVKCGVTGAHLSVTVRGAEEDEHLHDHHGAGHHDAGHRHRGPHDIARLVQGFPLPEKVREDVMAVYGLLAEAEGHVHGTPVPEIHFHEVGTMDAVADITAVCLAMRELAADEVVVSPVHVGSGQVKCAHGILPVPAPATAHILRGVPIYGGEVKGELCTPTGAALLKHFASRFGDMPVMTVRSIGYGMGKKDFPRANCVRTMLGETAEPGGSAPDESDRVPELSCNVDDMTAEALGFAMERLFEGGALEVYTIPAGMKKSRPGTLLRVLCREEDKERMIELLFRHTTTIGVRETVTRRYVLDRRMETVHTPYGEVRRKVVSGYGVHRAKYEYDDLSRIAREQNISLREVLARLEEQA